MSSSALILSMDQAFINKLKQDRYFDHLTPPGGRKNTRYQKVFIRSDRWRYGDLFGLCYLPEYKFELEPFKKYERIRPIRATGRLLYIIGDSYLADKSLSGAFDGFDNVFFLDRRFPFGPITLDNTKQNILIMEFAERNLVDYEINQTAESLWTKKELANRLNYSSASVSGRDNSTVQTGIAERLNKILFNKDLSRNLELLLFDDKIFTPVKEVKAQLNYKMFNRLSNDIAVSTDKKRLLMNITVDTAYRQSDFRTIQDSEVSKLLVNLNAAQNYYRSIGFKKVYLSVIPNAASVYDDRRMTYNHLLERVEKYNHFPVISIYREFKHSQANLYYRSDTHWNPLGLDIWVAETNRALLGR
ncbi:hypothetical protein [Mucilaginibacter sp.]